MLIMVCGLPGTGKSTEAEKIKNGTSVLSDMIPDTTGATIFRTDTIRSELFEEGDFETVKASKTPEIYNLVWTFNTMKDIPQKYRDIIEDQREIVYNEMLEQVKETLENGEVAILDGTFSEYITRQRFYEIADDLNLDIYVVECVADREIIRKRLEQRKNSPDDSSNVDKMEIYDYMNAKYEKPENDLNDFNLTYIRFDTGTGNFEKRD